MAISIGDIKLAALCNLTIILFYPLLIYYYCTNVNSVRQANKVLQANIFGSISGDCEENKECYWGQKMEDSNVWIIAALLIFLV